VETETPLNVVRPGGVDLVFFDGGGAHRSAATSLKDALGELAPAVDVRLVDVTTDVFRYAPALRWLFGWGIALYNAALKAERMYFGNLRAAMRAGAWISRKVRRWAVPRIRAYYRECAPRLVVSFVPMHNRLLLEALRLEQPAARGIVVPVDFEELFPGYWFDADAGADYFCATARLVEHAHAAGIPADRVHALSGMPTHPRFHAPPPVDVAAERARLGLDPTLPTVLVFFGAQGSRRMVDIARRLDEGSMRLNLVVLCGHHAAAERELSSWVSRSRKHIVGFTRDVPALMRIADVFVGKPGPISIFEAMASRLPVVLWDNPAFGVLFDYNLEWVESAGVGVRVRSLDEICGAVARVLASPEFRERTASHDGDATGEIARAVVASLGPPPLDAPHSRASSGRTPSRAISR
jgi:processive 1,2-diacylglycerol beta-glucosyltransferase